MIPRTMAVADPFAATRDGRHQAVLDLIAEWDGVSRTLREHLGLQRGDYECWKQGGGLPASYVPRAVPLLRQPGDEAPKSGRPPGRATTHLTADDRHRMVGERAKGRSTRELATEFRVGLERVNRVLAEEHRKSTGLEVGNG